MTEVEERVARGIVAAQRARLDWLLRVPEWAELCAAGVDALGLPGQRQGIGGTAAVLALALEHKHQLVRWVLEHCRSHVRSVVGCKLARLCGLEWFDGVDVDEHLTIQQWQRLRDAALFRLAQEHRRYKHAQQLLFTGYHALVDRVVAHLVYRPEHRADCRQEGALGLLAAIDRVDESGGDLGSYAAAWIRRHVRNFLLRQRLPVQAPVNLVSAALALRQTVGEDTPPADAVDALGALRLQVRLLECLRQPAVALDDPLTEKGGTVAESVADEAAVSPAEAALHSDLQAWVNRGLDTLTAKQREVLIHRYGLAGGPGRTLSDIARAAGISHQQAGMRERRALARLEAVLAPLAAEWQGAD